jgi:hypothetical protein
LTARSAVFAGRNFTLEEVADTLPCADFGLLGPLKRSREYASIRKRVADPKPIDAWQMDMVHYFLFQLPRPGSSLPTRSSRCVGRMTRPYPLASSLWIPAAPG